MAGQHDARRSQQSAAAGHAAEGALDYAPCKASALLPDEQPIGGVPCSAQTAICASGKGFRRMYM